MARNFHNTSTSCSRIPADLKKMAGSDGSLCCLEDMNLMLVVLGIYVSHDMEAGV